MASSVGGSTSVRGTPRGGKRGKMTAAQAIDAALGSMDNEGLQELCDLLRAQPAKILPTLRFARNASVGNKKTVDADTESDFHDTYRKLWRIPKDFLKEYLRSLDQALAGLSPDSLARCEKSAEGSIRSVLHPAGDSLADILPPQRHLQKYIHPDLLGPRISPQKFAPCREG